MLKDKIICSLNMADFLRYPKTGGRKVLTVKPRALYIPGKHSTTEPTHSPLKTPLSP